MADTAQKRSIPRAGWLPAVRLEHLWPLVALCAIGVLISLARTVPNDFWWHLKAGQLTATSGIPNTNIFSWSLPADAPFIYQSWLGELLFYWLFELGGLPLTIFARNMLGLTAFGLVLLEAYRRSQSWKLASVAALLALAMAINNLTARTQNWSWVPFALVLVLLGRYTSADPAERLAARWLVALPLLMIFWVNAHGGFMMGLLATGAFVAGETLSFLLRQPRALSWQRLGALYLTVFGMVAVTVINPLGVGVFSYVYTLLTDAPSQGLVIEWQPADPESFAGAVFFGSVLLLVAAFAFARRRPGISDVILVCGLLWMGFSGVRYIVWFGMAAMPIVAQALAAPRTSAASRPLRRRPPAGVPALNLALVGLLVLLVVVVQPWFKPVLPLPETYTDGFAAVPGAPLLFSDDTPVAATAYLRAEPCAGQLFNDMGYGSYLIWALYPQAQVFMDPRVELYPLEQWQDYIRLTSGRTVPELLARYNIACVLLDTERQERLSAALANLPGWQRTYADARSEVWRRVSDV